ncbi:hypothetical protein SKAU_G00327860 [Synaphobranchus kaupii]|uniref:Uncharacterized protein n=1 Tax=Synaphobranchus kaupii TaxID=118154 RepID=A0A9Q1EQ89_SYNKA|nr:hypothetical protein SKAU_G00327860 [Synaphobranchus kaupii]
MTSLRRQSTRDIAVEIRALSCAESLNTTGPDSLPPSRLAALRLSAVSRAHATLRHTATSLSMDARRGQLALTVFALDAQPRRPAEETRNGGNRAGSCPLAHSPYGRLMRKSLEKPAANTL